ncbi:cytochrome P450 [Mucidula mucida]|nr:cytochrome P450 [Mucidula mucida]
MPQLALVSIFLASTIAGLLRLYVQYSRVVNAPGISETRGIVSFIRTKSALSSILPTSTRFVLGQYQLWLMKDRLYGTSGWKISANISLFPRVRVALIVGDAETYKEITSDPARFPKPVEQYTPLLFFGPNIVATEGDQWKKYRKICAPAFSESNLKLAWDESINAITEYFDTVHANAPSFDIDNFRLVALPLTLRVIAAAGFGRRLPWEEHSSHAPRRRMSLDQTFQIVAIDAFYMMIFPSWLAPVMPPLKRTQIAFDELRCYLQDIINDRRNGNTVNQRADLFSNLLEANASEEEYGRLNDDELIGNIYVFLLAAHKNAAHTLTWALALLALHDDEQEKLYTHIKEISSGVSSHQETLAPYTRSLAVCQETLRMYTPNLNIPKTSAFDTTVTAHNADGRTISVPVPKGTTIVLHAPGIHYDPKYWKNPYNFEPDRFLQKEWPRHAYVPFSAGIRSCLGRRFAETVMVAMLNAIIAKYKVAVMDEDKYQAETFEERKKRVLSGFYAISNTPTRVPLTFTMRN